MSNRDVNFEPDEMRRIRECCRSLGTSYAEFIRWATMQSVSECEGLAADQALVTAYYSRENE